MLLGKISTHQRLTELAKHMVKCLKAHEHSADATVRRWAAVACEIDKHPEIIDLLVRLSDADMQSVASATLWWTLSDCNRRKQYVAIFPNQ